MLPSTQLGAGQLHHPQSDINPIPPCLGEPPSQLCSYAGDLETPFLHLIFPSKGCLIVTQLPCSLHWNKHKLICSCTLQDQTHQFVQRIPCFATKNSLWMKITPGFGFYGYYCTKENSKYLIYLFLSYYNVVWTTQSQFWHHFIPVLILVFLFSARYQ